MTTANNGELTSKIAIKHNAGVLFGDLVWIDSSQLMFSIETEITIGTVAELRLNFSGVDENLYMLIQVSSSDVNNDKHEHTSNIVHCHEYDHQVIDKWISDTFPERSNEWTTVTNVDYEEATCSKKAFLDMVARIEKRRQKKRVTPTRNRTSNLDTTDHQIAPQPAAPAPTTPTDFNEDGAQGLGISYPGAPSTSDNTQTTKPIAPTKDGPSNSDIARALSARRLASANLQEELNDDPPQPPPEPVETKELTSPIEAGQGKSIDRAIPPAQEFDDETTPANSNNKYLAAMIRRGSLRGTGDSTQRILKGKNSKKSTEQQETKEVSSRISPEEVRQVDIPKPVDRAIIHGSSTTDRQLLEEQVSKKTIETDDAVATPSDVDSPLFDSEVSAQEPDTEDSSPLFNLSPYGDPSALAALQGDTPPPSTFDLQPEPEPEPVPEPEPEPEPVPPRPTIDVSPIAIHDSNDATNEVDPAKDQFSYGMEALFQEGTYTIQWSSLDEYKNKLPEILAGTLVLPAQDSVIRRLVLKLPDGQKIAVQISPMDLGDGHVDLKPRVATMVKLKLKRAAKD